MTSVEYTASIIADAMYAPGYVPEDFQAFLETISQTNAFVPAQSPMVRQGNEQDFRAAQKMLRGVSNTVLSSLYAPIHVTIEDPNTGETIEGYRHCSCCPDDWLEPKAPTHCHYCQSERLGLTENAEYRCMSCHKVQPQGFVQCSNDQCNIWCHQVCKFGEGQFRFDPSNPEADFYCSKACAGKRPLADDAEEEEEEEDSGFAEQWEEHLQQLRDSAEERANSPVNVTAKQLLEAREQKRRKTDPQEEIAQLKQQLEESERKLERYVTMMQGHLVGAGEVDSDDWCAYCKVPLFKCNSCDPEAESLLCRNGCVDELDQPITLCTLHENECPICNK